MSVTRLHFFKSAHALTPDQSAVQIPGKKSVALLAYLGLSSAKVHSREALSVLLWPDLNDGDARNNLRVTLTKIKKILGAAGDQIIVADRHNLQINTDSELWFDVKEFKSLLASSATHSHNTISRCENCIRQIQQALALYTGDFLEGFYLPDCEEFEQWQLGVREQLRSDAIDALTTIGEAKLEQGDFSEAEKYSRQLLDMDPFREDAHRRVMRLMSFQNHRAGALKHFATMEKLFVNELGVKPDVATVTLLNQIERNECQAPAVLDTYTALPASPNNLPLDLTPFIDSSAVGQLEEHLKSQRLITLTGMGGIGKTRLSLQLARISLSEFPDGVFFIRLSALQKPEDIVTAVAEVLDPGFEPVGDIRAELLQYLRSKKILLVMDNFEHLIEGRDFLSQLLETAADIKLIVTSRQKLMISGEAVYPVSGLPFTKQSRHQQNGDTSQSAANELFVDTAKRVRLDFKPNQDDLNHIDRIAEMVEGHPLAIVLAASWLESLSCQGIADELDQSIELLQTSTIDFPVRQRSVEAAFSYSWGLLTDDEQTIFASLAVFKGGFDRQAAGVVAGASLHDLSTLLTKSLLQKSAGMGRYELHELMRQFAEKKLYATGRAEEVFADHSHYYMQSLKHWSDQFEFDRKETHAVKLSDDFENVRSAWHNATSSSCTKELASAVNSLRFYCSLNGREHDLIGLIEPLLAEISGRSEANDQQTLEFNLLLALGVAYRNTRGFLAPELTDIFERAWALNEKLEDSPELFAVLYGFWSINIVRADFDQCLAIVEIWKKRLDKAGMSDGEPDFITDARFIVHSLEGPIRYLQGDFVKARQILMSGLAIDNPERHEAIVALYGLNFAVSGRYWLSLCLMITGQPTSAWKMAGEVKELAQNSHQPMFLAFACLGFSVLSILKQDSNSALRYSRELVDIISEHRLGTYFSTQGKIIEASALPESDRVKGIKVMQKTLNVSSGARAFHDFDRHLLVSALIENSDYDTALETLISCDELCRTIGLRVCAAQSPLLRGGICAARKSPDQAREFFLQALQIAIEQGAVLFEFRAQQALLGIETEANGIRKREIALKEMVEAFPEMSAFN